MIFCANFTGPPLLIFVSGMAPPEKPRRRRQRHPTSSTPTQNYGSDISPDNSSDRSANSKIGLHHINSDRKFLFAVEGTFCHVEVSKVETLTRFVRPN